MEPFSTTINGEFKQAYYKMEYDIVAGFPVRQIIIWRRKGE